MSPSIMCTPEDELRESLTKSFMGKMNLEASSSRESISNRPSPEQGRPGTSSMESSVISDPGSVGKFRTKAAAVGKFISLDFVSLTIKR